MARPVDMNSYRKFRHYLSSTPLRIPVVWYRHRHIQSSDVVLASYPRSGSHWLSFMLFEMLVGQDPDFKSTENALPEVWRGYAAPEFFPGGGHLLRTHEQARPEYKKAIYLVRDVRDVAISEYAYLLYSGIFSASFDTFLRRFVLGRVNCYGDWRRHVGSWRTFHTEKRAQVHWVRYEDLKTDPERELAAIADFIGMKISPVRITKAVLNNDLPHMRDKEDRAQAARELGYAQPGHRFVRTGQAGGWRKELLGSHVELLEAYASEVLLECGYRIEAAQV